MLKPFYHYLTSRRFAIYIMACMLLLLLAGALLPSPGMLPPQKAARFAEEHPYLSELSKRFNVENITSSWVFIILPAFLFASIALCTTRRIINFLRVSNTFLENSNTFKNAEEIFMKRKISMEDIKIFFRRRRWKVEEGGRALHCVKGRTGFFGSLLFHAGMLVAFTGIILSTLTSFRGSLMLIEGMRTDLRNPALVVRKPILNIPLPDIALVLDSFAARFGADRTPLEYSAFILFEDENSELTEKKVGINRPLKYRGLSMTLQRYGVTPEFVLKDTSENIIFHANVNLTASTEFYDMFNIFEEGLTIYTKFYPDMELKDGEPFLRSMNRGAEGFHIILKDKNNNEFKGSIYVDSEEKIGDYIISIKNLKHWIELDVSRDYGINVIISAFVMIILGLMVRFIDYDRTVLLMMDNDKIYIKGHARIFRGIFKEELEGLIRDISEL